MTRATNAGHPGSGQYATARRGGLTTLEIRQAEALRAKRWSWQNIANVLGRCREDVQMALEAKGLEAIAAPTSQAVLAERAKLEAETRDRRFIEMWGSNASVADIADHFSVSTTTINAWRIRLALPSRLLPTLPKSSPGRSKSCGAEARQTAELIANSYGLTLDDLAPAPSRARQYSYPRQHIMCALVSDGYSTASIANLLHTGHATVIFGANRHLGRQTARAAA